MVGDRLVRVLDVAAARLGLRPAGSDDREPPVGIQALLAAVGLPAAFLALTVVAHVVAEVPFGEITREPTLVLEGPPLTGIQSNIGVLILWAGAISCLGAWAILRHDLGVGPAGFFLWAGLITALLAIDDLFLLHDDIFVDVLGQNERRTMLVYALIVLVFLGRYRRSVLASRSLPLLVLAIVLLGASTATDQLADLWADQEARLFVEDALKLVGITAWSLYFMRRAYYAVLAAASVSRASA